MAIIVNLLAGNYLLKLEADESSKWCKVHFIDFQKDSCIFLGADDLMIIASRLYAALKSESLKTNEAFQKNDNDLFWILSLFEKHASIYGSLTSSFGMKLFLVEDSGQYLPELDLNKQNIEEWIFALETVLG